MFKFIFVCLSVCMGDGIPEKRYETMQSEITILVSKLMSTFAHETRKLLTTRVFVNAHETRIFSSL